MPNTSESPAETRMRSAAGANALSRCSATKATARGSTRDPLRELLRRALRCDLVAGVGGEDLGDRVRILRVLHDLDHEAELHRLVVAFPHQKRALQPLVARPLPRLDHLADVLGRFGFLDYLGQPLQTLIGLAVEHVRVRPVYVVEALEEVRSLRRVDGEGVATAADRSRHRIAHAP